MLDAQPGEIRLQDYEIPCYLIDATHLHFELGDAATLVKSTLQIRLNPGWPEGTPRPLILHGVDLELRRLAIDGVNLNAEQYQISGEELIVPQVPKGFELECVTLIKPQLNTSLEGLYRSNSLFCTQCEAEGFRKITYFADRPDVMSIFTTTLVADKKSYPVLLSNGNDIARGKNDGGRHWVTWHDPFPKPAYLFALVAGDLVCIEDTFTTCSGRDITLRIYVEEENKNKCRHAMNSLQESMRWDEHVYGREYDLDIFMIVAVNDFNMGAMENKGLNIFNSSCVLANAETATDQAYQRVEGVVAHEYFHNWSGNRVTCRDWFQLSLKEGFTVFRDQEFSADMGSRTVKRIDDVSLLRTMQFAEDAGPMAHPIRPEAYMEISNFYTVTIYEKGAEVIRMLHALLGAEDFRKGSDLYFERHDGQAVTTEDFIVAMADATGADLSQFERWYGQVGTPELTITDDYDGQTQRYRLHVKQTRPDRDDGQEPLHIPLAIGLIAPNGDEWVDTVLDVVEAEQTFLFKGITERPLPSLLRGFSAPVKLQYQYLRDDLMFLMKHDSDGFNRWEASQRLAIAIIKDNVAASQQGNEFLLDDRIIHAYRDILNDTSLDSAMVARLLQLPSMAYLTELYEIIDIDAIHASRQFLRLEIAKALSLELKQTYHRCELHGDYRAVAEDMAKRSLRNTCLGYLMLLDNDATLGLCLDQYYNASNMTERQAAFAALVHSDHDQARREAIEHFYKAWQHDALVLDQWFAAQASSPRSDVFDEVQRLTGHDVFAMTNPNKIRSLIGVFCNQNMVGFHRADGLGYQFLVDKVLELNGKNPQIAARLLTPMTRWRRYPEGRREMMRVQLQRIQSAEGLSKDVFEVVSKTLDQ